MTVVAAPPRAATAALSVKEVRLLAGTSTLWAGSLLTATLCVFWSGGAGSRWATFPANSGRASLILAGVVLLIGHLAASRDHRHGVAEFAATLPASPRRRAVALLALVPAAGVAGALVEGIQLAVLAPSRPAGGFTAWLLVVPALIPMIGAALGVAAGLWWPSAAGGPLTMFAATAVLAMLPIFGSGRGDLPGLLFPVPLDESTTAAAAGWHVLYLTAALAVLAGAVLARHWRRWAAAVVAVALIAAVVALERQDEAQPPTTPTSAAGR